MKRFRSNNVALYIILFLAILFLGAPCPDAYQIYKWEPISGTIVNSADSLIPGVQVVNSIFTCTPYEWFFSQDSTATSSDGVYYLQKGLPTLHSEPIGCSAAPRLSKRTDFALRISHPDYGTQIALFVVDSIPTTCIPKYNDIIDTIFYGGTHWAYGSQKTLPRIVMSNRR